MIKFFALDVLLVGGVAVSSGPALDSALAPSFFGRPLGQLPYPHCTMPSRSRQVLETDTLLAEDVLLSSFARF